MSEKTPITVAHGDGIGPEIMDAALRVLDAAGAQLDIETIEIGESVYNRGFTSGIEPGAWDSLRRTRVFFKAPITTPQGGGVKSLNVTIRKTLGLFANVRPCRSYSPFITTKHPFMNVVVIRENEEDLYAGIEHRQTHEVTQCLKLISRPGCERIVRYAFEYAKIRQRRKVTCITKDNIMKLTDGLFHRVFDEVGIEYPEIEKEHLIVDIGMARLADAPEAFDVIVLPNLYGDILSDVAAEISGSVGLAGSANVGTHGAMFEAIHGSAPDIAGRNIANPSGLIKASAMMLAHVGQGHVAAKLRNAWRCVIEDGIHTNDVFHEGRSKKRVGTKEFADAVIDHLGQEPRLLPVAQYLDHPPNFDTTYEAGTPEKKELVGIDVFIDWNERKPRDLGDHLKKADNDDLELQVITNRGVKVWPDGFPETFCTDHWRCRFYRTGDGVELDNGNVIELLSRIRGLDLDFIKTEHLYTFDGKPGFSLAQGQ